VTVRLFFTRGTGVAAVGGVSVGPTVGSAFDVFLVEVLGLHGGN